LFAPGNRPELLNKFPRCHADLFCIDLEDAIPENERGSARNSLRDVVTSLRGQGIKGQLFVRPSGRRSIHAPADVSAALASEIDGLVVPKLQTAGDLEFFENAVRDAETAKGRPVRLIGLVETLHGVSNVEKIAAAANSHLTALAFGAEDFITEIGGRRTSESAEVLYARSRVVLAAKAAGLQALDQVFMNLRDLDGFRRDAESGRNLGYTGKMCVLPRQAEIANEVFTPSDAEVERSRRLIQTFEEAKRNGRGAIEFEGALVDEPVVERAKAIMELATRLKS